MAQSVRTFRYLVIRPLTIRVVGQGSVGAFAGTTPRRLGATYSITATPAAGWIFSGWSGSWSGAKPAVNVAMREGLDATATFVQNPFIARRGIYVSAAGSPDARASLRIHLNAFGKVTGQLSFAGKSYAILGQFRLNGRATIRLARPNAAALLLVLDMNGDAPGIVATLIDGAATTSLNIAPAS